MGFVLVVLFILLVSLGPLLFVRVSHALSGSPDRASRINGTWVGRVTWSQGSPDRWEMPPEGSGNWTVLVQAHQRLFTSMDAAAGTVTLCSDTGVRSTAKFDMGILNSGNASLDVYQNPPSAFPIVISSTNVSPRDGKLLFSGSLLHAELRGILHPGQVSDFDQLCKATRTQER